MTRSTPTIYELKRYRQTTSLKHKSQDELTELVISVTELTSTVLGKFTFYVN